MAENTDRTQRESRPSANPIRACVLMVNMGGPENTAEVRPFIRSLFNDPCIMQIPGPVRWMVSTMLATFRAPNVRQHYEHIGGKSPLKALTAKQAEKTRDLLHKRFPDLVIRPAYSYSWPRIGEAVEQAISDDFEKILVLPMYPQYSRATRGSIAHDLQKAVQRPEANNKIDVIEPYYDHPLYIKATVDLLHRALEKIDRDRPFRTVFTAHALPQSYIDNGDPYREQIDKTIALVLDQVALDNPVTSFQSKVGPVKWMHPSTIGTIRETGALGFKQVLVIPIGFVCDHLETLYELDIELAEIAHEAGIETFVRGEVFNDHEIFIELMASCIIKALS
ncbi:MAG: ferrochelatase [candidate division Zixibacteria bacterium]|nr:ferrochelatase [candidate division Zixibacteria bacterium]